MFRGERIDTMVKEMVKADVRLSSTLRITPRFKFGPDFVDPAAGRWYDITTSAQWTAHIARYEANFGANGVPILH